ncbi:mitochondrial ribosomal protein subunit L20-domain-containing protein [Tricharina praecox]|uniref:mitochondrial ribosomal protein subunit L20-domain-containing protein n=1 Tax=Tricharina praecox TaxID=43433 RepID=UPI00221F3F78|nr:mitochondrial ribosomal protein subunit L20-domain-containing protein [Tricharina praecox]KAI5858062.1 mitochondrial ribosomal protein subunit L20-domain-containing protein [Tricharina praecox]
MNSFTRALRQSLSRPTTSLQKSFVRHESSSRRHTKKLRLHPHPSMKLTADSPRTSHVIYNPPSSAPTPLITPTIFLPKDDSRRELLAAAPKPAAAADAAANLPPPVRQPYEKTYHLTEEDFAEIRRLRAVDPVKNNRTALAKQFDCSTLFIGMVCQATEGRIKQMKARDEGVKNRWGTKRSTAREDRQRRRAGWGGADGL